MRTRIRAAVLTLGVLVSTVGAIASGPPAQAADVIAIGSYPTVLAGAPQCAQPVGGWNGAEVVLRPCDTGAAQAWARVGVGGGYYYMINQAYPAMCMDLRDGKTTGGTTIQIWSCTNYDGMKWSFERVVYPFDRIRSKRNPTRCLDVAGASLVINYCSTQSVTELWEIRF